LKSIFILSLSMVGLCELLGGLLGYLATVTGVRQPYWEQAAGLGVMQMAQMRRRPFFADMSILDQVYVYLNYLVDAQVETMKEVAV
jgi:hypothetical protein